MKQEFIKSRIFAQSIKALRNHDLGVARQLLDDLDLASTELAAIALRDKISREITHANVAGLQQSAPVLRHGHADRDNSRWGHIVVVTPTMNSEKFIDETIASVVEQRGAFHLHYHVQDGGSTDGTLNILKAWAAAIHNSSAHYANIIFSWDSQPDAGMYSAVSRGFENVFSHIDPEAAKDAIMTWINADDILPLRSLWTAYTFFEEHPELHWITGLGALINESGALIDINRHGTTYSQRAIASGLHDGRAHPFIQQEGTFWRSDLWFKAGGLRSASFRLAGDWELWRRFAAITPLIQLSTVLGIHRRRQGQLSENMAAYYTEMETAKETAPTVEEFRNFGMSAVYSLPDGRWNIVQGPSDDSPSYVEKTVALSHLHLVAKKPPPRLQMVEPPRFLPSGRAWPKISVITPTFNQGKYIAETIESVLQQKYPNIEHIVIDGLSTDNTPTILERYKNRLSCIVSEKDSGQSDALNKGFKLATGDILCWLNSDDQFAPGALHAVALAFDTHAVDIVSGICEIYENGNLVHRHLSSCKDGPLPLVELLDLDKAWNAGQFFYQPEVFFSRSLWLKVGGYVREDCYYSMDYELWCRFAYAKARLHVIGSPLARFRAHPEQKTADPSKFKAELTTVRAQFAREHSVAIPESTRPEFSWDRRMRVAMVNDIGLKYGAGIAQGRLAACIEMAGHDVKLFALDTVADWNDALSETVFLAAIQAFKPDVVIFGNLHAVLRESTSIVQKLGEICQTYWVTHDFWLFTGRCAYPGSCEKYLMGCDAECPTADEYPQLSPLRISGAWASKRALLASHLAPVVLANSAWSRDFVKSISATADEPAYVKLGVPNHLYKPMPKSSAREELGINQDRFVIAYSVSSISDERKGGRYLIEALTDIGPSDISLLLIGNQDKPLEVPGVEIISLGYVTDTAILVAALNAADIYVGPSIAETFGQVFIEAAMVGTPSIGFDQTGVKDAIIEGVTGLRVKCNAGALRNAILRFYNDNEFCNAISYWSKIYAANEFSLESSYRSLFHVWQSTGLIDNVEIPHKIGFIRSSVFLPSVLGDLAIWRPENGISATEGPYFPEFPSLFRWCHGKQTKVKINCRAGGAKRISIRYQNPLFDRLKLTVYWEGIVCDQLILSRTTNGASRIAEILVNARPGWNSLLFSSDFSLEPSSSESRELTFMLLDIGVTEFPLKEALAI